MAPVSPIPVALRKKEILEVLRDDHIKTIVLYGEAGVGKTWTAKEVSNLARQEGLFHMVLWLYLSRRYRKDTLVDSIAQQLFLLPTPGEFEVDETVKEDLSKRIQSTLSKGKFLLILDDEGNRMKESGIMIGLNSVLGFCNLNYKLIITTRIRRDAQDIDSGRSYYLIHCLVSLEAKWLFKKKACTDGKFLDFKTVAEELIERAQGMPSAIILMAKALKYFSEKGAVLLLKRFLEKSSDRKTFTLTDLLRSGYDLVPNSILIDCQRDYKKNPFFFGYRCIHYNELIVYWMMEGFLGHVSCMEKTFKKGYQIFLELIDFQVLKRVEANYVTITLFKEDFADFLSQRFSDDCRRGFQAYARLGLNDVFAACNNWNGSVSISHTGGVAGTPNGGKQQPISALLFDGNSLTSDLPRKFMKTLKQLQVLGCFNPTIGLLSSFSFDDSELHVFVLRNCRYVEIINRVVISEEGFKNLSVLEISGPVDSSGEKELSGSSLFQQLAPRFFQSMPKLQSLNLSSLPLVELPQSLYELGELKWLILRDCTSLRTLSSLTDLENLVMLDCSGSTSLDTIQDRSFLNANLKMINMSRTNIRILPLLTKLQNLTHLLLSNCPLNRLRSITATTSLEVIDLSNVGNFSEFYDKSFERLVHLKVLDLSGTSVSNLPDNIGNPRCLYLKNCTHLESKHLSCLASVTNLEHFVLTNADIQSLPPISHLTNLQKLSVICCLDLEALPDLSSLENIEELDFSGCKSIKVIPDKTFDKLSTLQKINLSGTSIASLPSLENLCNLRRLLLKDCMELKMLPISLKSTSLEKLEELNISGGTALRNIDADFLDGAVNLHILDLSNTSLVKLPSFSKLGNLRELYLRNCKDLKSVPDLGNLISLEILDLSGSAVSALPLLSNLIKLHQLLLKNCSSLSLFQEMGTLNALGASVQKLPYGISGLTSLERLDLPTMDFVQGANIRELSENSKETKSDGGEWGISNLLASKEKRPSVSVSGTQFLHSLGKDPLLWKSMLKKFHLYAYPIEKLDGKSVLRFHGDDFIYRDMYLQNRHIGESDDQRLLEIYGFSGYKPEGIDTVINRANQIFFVDNNFHVRIPVIFKEDVYIPATERNKEEIIQTLSTFLTACDSKQIKGCWIEKCREMEVIFCEKEIGKILDVLNSVGTLWVSNVVSLKRIFELPQDGASEKKIQEDGGSENENADGDESEKDISIDGGSEKETPEDGGSENENAEGYGSEKKISIDGGSGKEIPEDGASENEADGDGSEKEILRDGGLGAEISEEEKESLARSLKRNFDMAEYSESKKEVLEDYVLQNLEKLYLECCPKLSTVLSLSRLPQNLKHLQIKFCDKLGKVFDRTPQDTKLQYLETLHLWELPALKSIGCQLPSLKTLRISNCPNLQKLSEIISSAKSLQNLWISNVHDLESIVIAKEFKYLSIDSCPNLLKIFSSSQLPSGLEVHIRFCSKLKTVFEEGTFSEFKLTKLHLHGLPELRSIGTTLPNQAACFIVDCPKLIIHI